MKKWNCGIVGAFSEYTRFDSYGWWRKLGNIAPDFPREFSPNFHRMVLGVDSHYTMYLIGWKNEILESSEPYPNLHAATRLVLMMGHFGNIDIARDFSIELPPNFPRMIPGVQTQYLMCQIGWTNEIVKWWKPDPNLCDSRIRDVGEIRHHCSSFPPWIFSKFS